MCKKQIFPDRKLTNSEKNKRYYNKLEKYTCGICDSEVIATKRKRHEETKKHKYALMIFELDHLKSQNDNPNESCTDSDQ